MAREVTQIRVFVACPKDVANAKKIIKQVCDDINQDFRDSYAIQLLMLEHETSVVPEFGPRPQALINQQIGEYDVFIGVLGKRFGTPSGGINPATGHRYESGTEEEFYIAYERWKKEGKVRISVHFKAVDEVGSFQEQEELQKVRDFRRKLRNDLGGWTNDFADDADFERQVRRFLQKVVMDFGKQLVRAKPRERVQRLGPLQRVSYPKVQSYLVRSVIPSKEVKSQHWAMVSDDLAKDLVEVIHQHNRVVLLGDAGCGKTTELRRVAAECSRDSSDFYPFLCLLSRFTNQPLSNMLDREWQRVPADRLLVILDGLDEVPPGDQNQAIRQVELFAEEHPAAHMLVSCRTNFYHVETEETPGSLLGFRSYVLLDLGEEQVRQYVDTRL